ncbi:MAG: hypothetical protein PHC61_00245 [Chitinivibrionales bacterium]|nr:hypothetical protein [Chitinivibrionales bacterium]
MKEPKTENYSFRLTQKMKISMMERSIELKKQPGEYILGLIGKDLAAKGHDLPDSEKTFIEEALDKYTDKVLSFLSANIGKRLSVIETKLLTKEERAAKIITELIALADSDKIIIKPETQQGWLKKLIESTDMVKESDDFKKIIMDKIEKNKATNKQSNPK